MAISNKLKTDFKNSCIDPGGTAESTFIFTKNYFGGEIIGKP